MKEEEERMKYEERNEREKGQTFLFSPWKTVHFSILVKQTANVKIPIKLPSCQAADPINKEKLKYYYQLLYYQTHIMICSPH